MDCGACKEDDHDNCCQASWCDCSECYPDWTEEDHQNYRRGLPITIRSSLLEW